MTTAKSKKFYDQRTFFLDEIPFHNTFREEKSKRWFKKKTHYLFFVLICLFQMGPFYGNWFLGATGYDDSELDSVPLALDLGTFTPLQKKRGGKYVPDVDEIFGNQYVKKEKLKDIVDNTVSEWNSMIKSAVNPVVNGATMPVDLMPELRPLYTTQARQAGVEGTVILELVVSKDGKVLRARPVGKKLGHGLEWEAVKVFKMKKFKPSTDQSGNALTVKFFQPVRFVLM